MLSRLSVVLTFIYDTGIFYRHHEARTNLLIIGAGPFGLAVAAQASHLGIEHLVVGKPMEFWRDNMPKGMYLRSSCDWHLDPLDIHIIESLLQSQGQTARDVEPLSLEF